jgi:hypothetical protein
MAIDKSKRIGKWYFGGFASAGAACCTHPLDLLKVHLQTAGATTTGPKPNLIRYFDFGFLTIKTNGYLLNDFSATFIIGH